MSGKLVKQQGAGYVDLIYLIIVSHVTNRYQAVTCFHYELFFFSAIREDYSKKLRHFSTHCIFTKIGSKIVSNVEICIEKKCFQIFSIKSMECHTFYNHIYFFDIFNHFVIN